MAASTRISYNPAAVTGGIHLANAVRFVILAQQEINRAVAVAASVTTFGVTPGNLEGSPEFNVPGPQSTPVVPTGQGSLLYSAMASLQSKLAAITSAQLADLDAGGN
jgi:hypothetical protein